MPRSLSTTSPSDPSHSTPSSGPHSSPTQARNGRSVDWQTEPIRADDLIFHRGSVPVHDFGHVGIAINATQWIVAPSAGDIVSIRPIRFERVQAIRRLVTQ